MNLTIISDFSGGKKQLWQINRLCKKQVVFSTKIKKLEQVADKKQLHQEEKSYSFKRWPEINLKCCNFANLYKNISNFNKF